MGLPIVKRLCELLDTGLELATEPGRGSTFASSRAKSRPICQFGNHLCSWAEVLKRAAHTKEIYGFFNNHFAGHSPASARDMQRSLGQQPVEPSTLGPQRSLF